MKKKIGDFTINELLNYLENKCKEKECSMCPFEDALCGSLDSILFGFKEDVGEDTLIEVEDE